MLPRDLQNILNTRGNAQIKRIRVVREPLVKALSTAGNFLTGNSFDKWLKTIPHDQLYHLSLQLDLEGGQTLYVEKNQRIDVRSITPNPTFTKNAQAFEVPYAPDTIRLEQFFDRALSKYGKDRILKYDLRSTNCQLFDMDLLTANGLDTQPVREFTMQDAKQAFSQNIRTKILGATFKGATNLAAFGGRVYEKFQNLIGSKRVVPRTNQTLSNIDMSTQQVYLDITTSTLGNPNSLVNGQKNNFTMTFPEMVMQDNNYNVTVIDFRYPTVDIQALEGITALQAQGITPLVQIDIAKPMIVAGRYGSLVYKGRFGSSTAEAASYHVDQPVDFAIQLQLLANRFSAIEVGIVRSDN